MLYEIINPSDKYTIEVKSLDVAFVACVFLGNGQYAFDPLEDGGEKIPLFCMGGWNVWCHEHFQNTIEAVFNSVTGNPEKCVELADCLDSCLIGSVHDRATYNSGLELIDDPVKREAWRAQWHDQRLTSMNDIGSRAYAMAKKLRAGAVKQEPVPAQVFTK